MLGFCIYIVEIMGFSGKRSDLYTLGHATMHEGHFKYVSSN